MNFLALQDEIIELRFKEGLRDNVKSWINMRYQWIWAQGEWPFKRVPLADLAITANDTTPTMPSDFGRPGKVFDDLGYEIQYVTPDAWSAAYAYNPNPGRPSAFTVINRQIYIGPTPNAAYTYKLTYERKVACYNSVAAITAGLMSADTDYPIWDAGHHYLLVLGGMATGLKMENDSTYESIEAEFLLQFNSMREDLLPPDRSENLQYGRDHLGMESWG